MLATYNSTRFMYRLAPMRKFVLTPSYYFSADSEQFIKKAKYLERLKTDVTFPQSFYEYGKYILLLKNEMVCLDSNDKLLFHSFQGLDVVAY